LAALLFVIVNLVFSQQSESLNISLEKNDNNSDSQLLNINLTIGSNLSQGAFIDLPAQIKPVIKSVKLNGNDLWLINSKNPVEKDNVIGWYTQDNGIVIHYNDAISGELEIQIGHDKKQLDKNKQIQVKIHNILRTV